MVHAPAFREYFQQSENQNSPDRAFTATLLNRQHLRRNHPKSLEEKGTGDTAEEERGSQRNTHGHDVVSCPYLHVDG